jgi:hypothetical protein
MKTHQNHSMPSVEDTKHRAANKIGSRFLSYDEEGNVVYNLKFK